MVDAFAAWIATKSASIQALAHRFPLRSEFLVEGIVYYLLGYTEPDGLWLSSVNPFEDYDGAVAVKFHVCGDCLATLHEEVGDGGEE